METHLAFGLRLLIATLLGGLIGLQRELSGKPAGLRTNLLICIGACLLTELSLAVPASLGGGDPARIAAQIVSGIGFLGAGTILQSRRAVHGLTSAATIWVVAGVGMVVGAGFERQAAIATALILAVLILLRRAEERMLGQHTVTFTVLVRDATTDPQVLIRRLGVKGRPLSSRWTRGGNGASQITVAWRGTVASAKQAAVTAASLPDLELERWELDE
ncbi:MAG: MgtC/SapB family protein [Acidobacteriota bacterium]